MKDTRYTNPKDITARIHVTRRLAGLLCEHCDNLDIAVKVRVQYVWREPPFFREDKVENISVCENHLNQLIAQGGWVKVQE
jgi:hypothetical protein